MDGGVGCETERTARGHHMTRVVALLPDSDLLFYDEMIEIKTVQIHYERPEEWSMYDGEMPQANALLNTGEVVWWLF